MKTRNIMVIIIINYLLIVVFSGFVELTLVDLKAKEFQLMVQTASRTALNQLLASDDFFKEDGGYMMSEQGDIVSTALNLKVPTRQGYYESVPAMTALTGLTEKDEIFRELYKGIPEFISLRNDSENKFDILDIKGTLSYWNNTNTGMAQYEVPKIAMMGLPITGDIVKQGVESKYNYVRQDLVSSMWKDYNFNETSKKAYLNGSTVEYNVTPLRLNIPYINEEALSNLFMNNLDLLMRGKYSSNGKNLNTEEGGNGVLKGNIYSVDSDTSAIDMYNPINNGSFTILRGPEINRFGDTLLYEGIKPTVRYKIIDAYNSANDELLKFVFGPHPTHNGSRAEYFRQQDLLSGLLDPATNAPYTEKPIVVAEITFYVDAIIPYSTPALREMRLKTSLTNELADLPLLGFVDKATTPNNFVDIIRNSTDGVATSSGVPSPFNNNSEVYVYKRIFAIMR